jgi:hypothetical protein
MNINNIQIGAMCGITALASALIVMDMNKDIQRSELANNTPIPQIPAPVEYIGDQTETEYELSEIENWGSKHCDTLTLMANNGMNPDGENYVMTISLGDLDVLNASKRICPQHF